VNDFGDLDELERELGPSLRLALRRAADQITDDRQGRDSLMSYLDTNPDERITPRETPGRGRRRVVVIVTAIAAAAAIIIAAIVLGSRDDESAPVDEPAVVTTSATAPTSIAPAGAVPPPYFLDLGTGERTPLADEIADASVVSYVPSPDGTQLAFYTCCGGDDVMTIANADGSGTQEVVPSPGLNAYGPSWSPDGTKLVYQERDGSGSRLGALVVVDLATGDRTQVVDFGDASAGWWFTSPRFSADGEQVLYHQIQSPGAFSSNVWSIPVTGGEPRLVVEDASYPLSVGDGSEIAFVTPNSDDLGGDSISIVRADGTSTPRTLVEAQSLILRPTVSPDGTRLAYPDGGGMWVVDLATGESTEVSEDGYTVDWVDDDTLIVSLAQ
jgi:hypothetical protein